MVWNSMEVFQWPYANPTSVVVLDSTAAWGATKGSVVPSISFMDTDEKTRADFRERVNEASSLDDLPDPDDITFEANVNLEAMCGITDKNAIRRIDISSSDGMYAFEDNDKEYHRPWCVTLQHSHNVQHGLHVHSDRDGGRSPCRVCEPHLWDGEAVRGDHKCLGPS